MTKIDVINGAPIFDDLRDLEKFQVQKKKIEEEAEKKYYIHQIPQLPKWTDRKYYYKPYTQNLFRLTCTCDEFKKKSLIYKNRDMRKLCYHLFWKLQTSKVAPLIDDLTTRLLIAHFKFGVNKFYKSAFMMRPLILGFNEKNDWISIFLERKDGWHQYSYNSKLRRWAYGIIPEDVMMLTQRISEIRVWKL